VEEVPLPRDIVVGSDRVYVVLLLLNNERVDRYLVAWEHVVLKRLVELVAKLLVVVVVVVSRIVDPVGVVVLISSVVV